MTHLVQSVKRLVVKEKRLKIQLQRVFKCEIDEFNRNRFAWLLKLDGIWLVRLDQNEVSSRGAIL